jgi:hypothetical protein
VSLVLSLLLFGVSPLIPATSSAWALTSDLVIAAESRSVDAPSALRAYLTSESISSKAPRNRASSGLVDGLAKECGRVSSVLLEHSRRVPALQFRGKLQVAIGTAGVHNDDSGRYSHSNGHSNGLSNGHGHGGGSTGARAGAGLHISTSGAVRPLQAAKRLTSPLPATGPNGHTDAGNGVSRRREDAVSVLPCRWDDILYCHVSCAIRVARSLQPLLPTTADFSDPATTLPVPAWACAIAGGLAPITTELLCLPGWLSTVTTAVPLSNGTPVTTTVKDREGVLLLTLARVKALVVALGTAVTLICREIPPGLSAAQYETALWQQLWAMVGVKATAGHVAAAESVSSVSTALLEAPCPLRVMFDELRQQMA